MKKNLLKKSIPYIILLGVIIYSYFNEINNNKKIDIFKKKGSITQGTIIKYNTTGAGVSVSYYLKYSYYVNNKEYKKSEKISLSNVNIYDASKFIGKKYKVYYNKYNPKEAYIDLKHEVK
jgi:hypothetical protein